jgi:hypothetical protein
MITVSIARFSSYAKWSWRSVLMRKPGATETVPELGSSAPDRTFKKVDFPAPLAPSSPYQIPGVNLASTFSNSGRAPNARVSFSVEIIAGRLLAPVGARV